MFMLTIAGIVLGAVIIAEAVLAIGCAVACFAGGQGGIGILFLLALAGLAWWVFG
jgi:hypothetical protein